MIVKILTLNGLRFELSFNDVITIQKIQQKLFSEYNFNTIYCFFCFSGQIISNYLMPLNSILSDNTKNTIIIFNYKLNIDLSYPIFDLTTQLNFSRYSDNFVESQYINTQQDEFLTDISESDDDQSSIVDQNERIYDADYENERMYGADSDNESSRFYINYHATRNHYEDQFGNSNQPYRPWNFLFLLGLSRIQRLQINET